ncbi:MAG: transporter substrate-binding domain-containing protein [Proteobacteria bacterium]|nr:transporter substrate-binding domain-containing protein [Pseudomonadota bacterium]MBU1650107.1 transporter substrate-binding domain-containing protein [Pseudomonadota bacterium]MBU1985714.1 transporter substrate-binding domain-containing protein [Pseudomonadota bacterium]
MRNYIIQPLLTALTLLFFFSLSACGPDVPEYVLPTKKMSEHQKIIVNPLVVPPKPLPPEPLADPEIAAAPDILRVGVSQDVPPFMYQQDKKIQGLEADLAQQLGIFSGRTIQFIKVPKKKAKEALLKGHIDIIMSGLKINNLENQAITFSDPYLRAGQILMVRSRDMALFSTGIYSLEDSGFTLGVIEGSSGDLFLTRTIRGVRIMRFKTVEKATQALKRKRIDLFLHDAPTICYYAAINKSAGLSPILTLVTEEYLGWEMRKDDDKLRQQANHFIQQSKIDGQLQKTIKQWIPNL